MFEDWQIKKAAVATGLNYDYAREIVKTYNQKGTAALNQSPQSKRAIGA